MGTVSQEEYFVRFANDLGEDDIAKIQSGIVYQGVSYRPAKISEVEGHTCHITLTEGKFHEIKLIFEALGNEVTYLRRLRMKNLELDEDLAPGEYRYLNEEEIRGLKEQN